MLGGQRFIGQLPDTSPRQPAATAKAHLFNELIDCRGTAVHLCDVIQAAPIGNARFAWKERPGCSEHIHPPCHGSSRRWVLETLHPVKVMKPRTTAKRSHVTAPRGTCSPLQLHPELLFRTKTQLSNPLSQRSVISNKANQKSGR